MQHFSITDINPAMAHARRVIGAFEEHQITGFGRTGRRTDVIEPLGSQPAHIPAGVIDDPRNVPRAIKGSGRRSLVFTVFLIGSNHILITHQDTDHVGAVEADSPGLFRNANLYIGEIENRYLTGEVRRKVIYHLYKLPQVTINNEKVLLHDGQVLDIDGVRIECFLVPGHTWGHMVYLVDEKYLFTGDTLWFGADGGYSFISSLAEDNKLAVQSLAELERKLRARGLHPYFITGHTGWTDNFAFAFAHKDKSCSPFKKRVHDPSAPYDAYDESDDTEENAKSGFLKGVGR